ncbi:MAG: hypothetical protein PVH95_10355 [Anaerolineae bacterium]|jgi:hypothetical protein
MTEPLAAVTSILVLATVAEALVEHLFAPLIGARDDDEITPPSRWDWRPLVMRYTSVFLSVLLTITYRADLLLLLNLSPPWPWVGWVITGLLIGRGSNFIHDFASRWLTRPTLD